MADHLHEWRLHNTAYAGIPTAWATCECGADIDHDVIQRRLNATEQLRERHARVLADMAQRYAGDHLNVDGLVLASLAALAYASTLEGTDGPNS